MSKSELKPARWRMCVCATHADLLLGDGSKVEVKNHDQGKAALAKAVDEKKLGADQVAALEKELLGFKFEEEEPGRGGIAVLFVSGGPDGLFAVELELLVRR